MDNFPQNLIQQYFKASSKLKKFDRVFKRFAPNIAEVLAEFQRLAHKFEEASIHQYAAMCHLGVAKCQLAMGDSVSEVQSYLKSARCFLLANGNVAMLRLRSNRCEYIDGALKSYQLALERNGDDTVMKTAIIREMKLVQPQFDGTSSFASPSHRIHELELAANHCLMRHDFLTALEQLTDIVDNIYERKRQELYEPLLRRVEILRLLLLLHLNLSPSNQSPSHIKLLEYYYNFGKCECDEEAEREEKDYLMMASEATTPTSRSSRGEFIALDMKYVLADIVVAWFEHREEYLKCALMQLALEFTSLNAAQRLVIDSICQNINGNYS